MRGKILLVDDNEILRSEFKDWFEEYDITEASSAEGALAILNKPNELDLIILDVQMPGMDGLTALKKIKSTAPEKGVIIMTGYSTKSVAIQALKSRADSYVEKPFDLKEMRGIIEKELSARNSDGDPGDMDVKSKIEHVKRYLERNCFKKITLRDAADAVYLSPKYLSRIFRETADTGFTEYKLKVKIDQAKEILKTTGLSVKQISVKLGYENPESFIRQFKKIAKHTPSRYRKNGKRRR